MKNKIKAFFKNNHSTAIKAKQLSKKLDLTDPHEYAQLKEIMHNLEKEGFLKKIGKRFQLNKSMSEKLIGTLQLSDSATFGFVILENKNLKDIFIPEKYLHTALHGDKVEVELLATQRGKNLEGRIIDIVERSKTEIVGILRKTKSFYFVEPDDPMIHRDIYISSEYLYGAKNKDKVVVSDIEWFDKQLNPEGRVKEILGKSGTYDAEVSALAREFNLTYKFPMKVEEETKQVEIDLDEAELKSRLDLRNKNIFTIDPDDAKDFDDAVSIEKLANGNYEVGIHIADVSHYVTQGSEIDNEAFKRATSVYFVGKVIPMLHEKLSNEICSLVPNEDRLTYSVIAELNSRVKVENYTIKKSVINSKRRFTYNEVQKILDSGEGEFSKELIELNELAKKLRSKRISKGSINFHTPEVEFELNENGETKDIKVKQIKDSHKLVEEFMLLANQIVAKHVKDKSNKNPFPFVYRVHDLPDHEKLQEFSNFVKSLGYTFDTNSANNSKQFQALLEKVEGTEEESLINDVAIRSMAKAVYSADNIGHYGLGFKHYTHFTSPIRRYPDLAVHRLIFDYVENNRKNRYNKAQLDYICDHSSAQERNAVTAERESIKIKQIEYMQSQVGQEFRAVISGITNFGFFVKISQNLSEGLVRLKDLDDDYYIFDEKNYSLIGKTTKRRFRLGDKINVRVVRVDQEKREIDFILLD
ncbi:MAG: ribonuclease R [Melioribacteraceae bacterium]|nr:ribonuclease R [Melioribacteraceae bacterium]MCF8354944.1 ribonuclease R [Melioribacteraceae bacterium]MCF8392367.1 ribonuclease R [Melioribacteraceae bacterium]MCF8417887.1 ribonuclease R [Melioribacteraceae bacterium]